ncbi:HAD family hydrolase [Azospirillum rugosum]|uniref:HAD superfamily hydrolase (TIGR01490 family) n=1 Tax=Azospirillum rugosum TaxID=416170 RepID=A0ABS4SUE3_9PROT|nr:HAD family hydrolase [Azospirillum rugosum]MBP2295718.1 HAD superfamily hydrolase (TIGR01490 family) [Azospirillum rugosum]MDQ0526781.1 HAD superfamily hydrolase (TIGR01490 family) [Azospirillum rugosum]
MQISVDPPAAPLDIAHPEIAHPDIARAIAPGVAFFDFDGTLIHGDSLLMFIGEVIGHRRAKLAFLDALRSGLHRHARGRGPGVDLFGTIKTILLRRTLRGVPVADALDAAERLVHRVRWHAPLVETLKMHRREGRRVVVATGALDLYMPALLRGLEVDALLATGLEVADGRLTGHLSTGNCVRLDKAQRVRAWIAANGPVGETWGYGNRPSDLPMLGVVDRPTIVKI